MARSRSCASFAGTAGAAGGLAEPSGQGKRSDLPKPSGCERTRLTSYAPTTGSRQGSFTMATNLITAGAQPRHRPGVLPVSCRPAVSWLWRACRQPSPELESLGVRLEAGLELTSAKR